jgi:sialate O-acetylesterase
MPFYFAQIAATTYAGGMLGVWEGQAKVLRTVPHTGLAASNDIYDGTPNKDFAERTDPGTGWPLAGGGNPHPTNRPLVARRLADIALAETYGRTGPPVFGPMLRSHRIEGPRVIVEFDHAAGGLRTRDGKDPDWFELHDGTRWVKATARIAAPDRIELAAEGVAAPTGVRFGWHALARWNLTNDAKLPALPFRSR